MTSHHPDSWDFRELLRHYFGDMIYGANDGIITTFVVVTGAAGAHLSTRILIIIGVINLIADGFSMGASNFLSIRADAAVKDRQRGIVEPLRHALVTFSAFIFFGFIPLLAFFIPGLVENAFFVSCLSTGGVLFIVGALRVFVLERSAWLIGGMEMLGVGAVAAVVAYWIGHYLAKLLA